jgi:hypothetical protein
MASGRLGTSTSLATTTNATVYTVPTGYYSVFNVAFCNTQAVSVTIRLAIASNGSSVGASEWIEYDTTIPPKGVFERTGLVGDAGKAVVAWASTSTAGSIGSTVTVNVWGIETSTS